MDEEKIKTEFGEMWDKKSSDYVLVRNNDSTLHYRIMNKVFHTMTIIEDDDIAEYVINKMIENGIPIVDDFEKIKNKERPEPLFLSPELEAEYRKKKKDEEKSE